MNTRRTRWPLLAAPVAAFMFTLCDSPYAHEQQVRAGEQTKAAAAPTVTNIKGDLYRVRSDRPFFAGHYTVFLVTPQGIILGDPINRTTATWLQSELNSRFKQPVKFMLYSHHHGDHASGGAVFRDSAELIGHESFATELKNSSTQITGGIRAMDRNSDNQLTLNDEIAEPFRPFMADFDSNHDGIVTPAEMHSDVSPPESTFSARRSVTLGGKRVEMIHAPLHTLDMTALYFPAERALFVVDFMQPRTIPAIFDGAPMAGWIQAAKQLEALDFDTLILSHGEALGTKADVTAFRQYLEDLVAGVSAGIKRGQTLEQLQASDLLTAYKDWPNYERERNSSIAATFAKLRASGGK